MTKDEWWQKGVKFECQGSGKCCLSRGSYGYVYMTIKDRKRMAKHMNMPTSTFTKKYCDKTQGYFHLKENKEAKNCMFLKGKRCSVYNGRPTQCRTWPFWPENMNAKTWMQISSFCPGVGKGPKRAPHEIQKNLKAQERSDNMF